MKKRNIKKQFCKNKKVKFLPFLHDVESIIEKKYFFFDKETKRLNDEKRAKKKAKIKNILNIVSFFVNIAVLAIVLIVQLVTDDAKKVVSPSIDWYFMAIVIVIVAGIILFDSLKIFILLKSSTKKSRPFLAYKTSALGRYYDSITPMSTGGQPFQIHYMNKRGVRGDIATSIPLMRYITWQISYVFICSFALIYNTFVYGGTADPLITIVAWVATAVNLLIFTTIILLSVTKKFGPKLVIWALKFLSKIHIVKNYRKTFRKVMRFVVNYQNTFKTLLKKPLVLLSQLLLSIADIVLSNLILYFIVRSFVPASTMIEKDITWFKTFIQAIIISLSLGFIPTPGASGAAEGVFMLVFAGVFSESGLFWPVLVWRIATYYIYLLQGLLVLVYDFVVGNKKAERLKRQGAEIYNSGAKETFRQSIDKSMYTIEVVQAQERDKLPTQVFTGLDYDSYYVDEIIKDGDFVTKEEMDKKVQSAEDIMKQMNERANQRKIARNKKKMLKKNKKYKKVKE